MIWWKSVFVAIVAALFISTCGAQSPLEGGTGEPPITNCALQPDAPECQNSGQTSPSSPSTVRPPSAPSGSSEQQENPNDLGQPDKAHDLGTPGPTPSPTASPSAQASPSRRQLPPEAPGAEHNEFQNFVQIDTGIRLPIFGSSLFRQIPSTFADPGNVAPASNYVIGPDDELILRVWGQVTLSARVTVDREGNIYIPKVGIVNVAGLRYAQLHDRIAGAIGQFYRSFQLDVTLGRLRSIRIYVTGFARRPGAYTVSSLSTLVNALFTSGGPSAQGSMRGIQLKRGGKVVAEFDMYDFLLQGDTSKDVQLQPEDVILIPAIGPLAAIAGAVRVPAIYEVGKQSTLANLIAIAGGLSTVADASRVTIERIDGGSKRTVEEISLDKTSEGRLLQDGDIVRVVSLSPKIDNAVILRGNVAVPGRYQYRPQMRIHDLIPNREFLLTPDFWKGQIAVRQNEPYAQPPSAEQPAAKNAVKVSAPEINWNYAVVQRINPVDLSTRLIPFDLGKAIEGNEDANVTLMPGDIVTIFSQNDIAVPRDQQSRFVTVEGEVRAPGIYRIEPGDTLRTVLMKAGGVTTKAYLFGTVLTRESAREIQQKTLSETTQVLSSEVDQRAASDTRGRPEDAAAITVRASAQKQMLEQLRNTRASGRLVLQMQPSDTSLTDFPDIPMEHGDRVTVPQRIEMVHVIGAVYQQSSYVFRPGTNVRHYLRLAGSATQTADLKHALLVRADGSVVDRHSGSSLWRGGFLDLRIYPGDTLVIPTKLVTGAFQRNLRDWTQIASQLAIAGASLAIVTGH